QVADPLVLGDAGGRLVEDQRVPFAGEEQPEQQLDRGGLARPVGAEQAEDFAPIDLEVQRLQRLDLRASPEVAVDLGEVACLDNDVTAHHEGALCKTGKSSSGATPTITGRIVSDPRQGRAPMPHGLKTDG